MRQLSLNEVRALHALALELDGGAPGARDPNELERALAQPGLEVFGQPLHPALAAMAAAYLYHLCQVDAFADGNKRTALAAPCWCSSASMDPDLRQVTANASS